MGRKRHTAEQIIGKLRVAEIDQALDNAILKKVASGNF